MFGLPAGMSVGFDIIAHNHISPVLAQIAKDAARLKMGLGGALSISLGVGLIEGVYKMSEWGEAYQSNMVQAKILGMSTLEMAKMELAARQTSSQVLTSSLVDNLRLYRELRGVIEDPNMIPKLMPQLQQIAAGLYASANASGKPITMEQASEKGYDAVKGAELAGRGRTPEDMMKLLNGWFQAQEYFAGKVNMTDFHASMRMSKVVGNVYSDEFLTHVLPTMIQELKSGTNGSGSGAGQAMYALSRVLVQGRADHKTAEAAQKYGLIGSDGIILNKAGQIKGIKAGGWTNGEEAKANPYAWANDTYIPMLKKWADAHGKVFNEQFIQNANREIFGGNGKSLQAIDLYTTQQWKFNRDKNQEMKTMTPDQAYQAALKDPAIARIAMHQQLESLKSEIGKVILSPSFIKGMVDVAKGLAALVNVVENHQGAIKMMALGAVALGIFLVAVGAFAIGAAVLALPFAGIAIGISALIAGIAVGAILLVTHFGTIKKWFGGIVDWIVDFVRKLPGLHGAFQGQVDGRAPNTPAAANSNAAPGPAAANTNSAPPPGHRAQALAMTPQKMSFNGSVHLDSRKVGYAMGEGMPTGGSSFDPIHGNPFVTA